MHDDWAETLELVQELNDAVQVQDATPTNENVTLLMNALDNLYNWLHGKGRA